MVVAGLATQPPGTGATGSTQTAGPHPGSGPLQVAMIALARSSLRGM